MPNNLKPTCHCDVIRTVKSRFEAFTLIELLVAPLNDFSLMRFANHFTRRRALDNVLQ
jgi:hypothetical protein